MSTRLFLLISTVLSVVPLMGGDDSDAAKSRFQMGFTAPQSIVQKGERIQVQTVTPLMDNPPEVTVVDFGPRGWVLVSYEKKFLKLATEATPERQVPEKYQVWINFDQVIAIKKIADSK